MTKKHIVSSLLILSVAVGLSVAVSSCGSSPSSASLTLLAAPGGAAWPSHSNTRALESLDDASLANETLLAAQPPEKRTPRASKASGCGKSAPAGVKAGATSARSLKSNGLVRVYRVHYPTKATMNTKLPVVLNFHGRYGNGADQEAYSGLAPVSDRETFLLVSPDGLGSPTGWSAGATAPGGVDDVTFVNDLLDTLEREFCIDNTRVYATGFSNGAFMASRLACVMSDRIAATAPVSGVNHPRMACGSPVPMLAFHGSEDTVVPVDGGSIRGWHYPGAYAAMDSWSVQNQCSTETTSDDQGSYTKIVYWGCSAETAIILAAGAGHTWPGSKDNPGMGLTAKDFSGADMIWSFFASKSIQ